MPPLAAPNAGQAGAGSPPSSAGRPPFGPTTLPTASKSPGTEAEVAAKVQQAIEVLKEAIAKADITSPGGEAILNAMKNLGKHFPKTQADPGVKMTEFRNALQSMQQSSMLSRLGAGGAAAPPSPAGGAGLPA